MKIHLVFTILIVPMMLSACVTTRAQLNEKRGQQSEDVSFENEDSKQEKSPDLVKPAPVASQYGLEEMRAELARLSGKVEEMEHEKQTQKVAQDEEQQKLVTKITELEKQLKEKEEQSKGPEVPTGKTPLQAAKEAFSNLKFEAAIGFLDSFLAQNEKGKEVEEGTFVRAESFFHLKEFKKAIVDYSKFPEKFQKSNYHPKALLKIAECFEALEMKEEAKSFYQELTDKFPKTLEGKLAKKKLAGKSTKK